MSLILGLLAIAVLAVYLDHRYLRICEEDLRHEAEWHVAFWRGVARLRPLDEPDWNFPPKWHPPTGRTKA